MTRSSPIESNRIDRKFEKVKNRVKEVAEFSSRENYERLARERTLDDRDRPISSLVTGARYALVYTGRYYFH